MHLSLYKEGPVCFLIVTDNELHWTLWLSWYYSLLYFQGVPGFESQSIHWLSCGSCMPWSQRTNSETSPQIGSQPLPLFIVLSGGFLGLNLSPYTDFPAVLACLDPSRQILRHHPKLGHSHFLLCPFQFTNHQSSYHWSPKSGLWQV